MRTAKISTLRGRVAVIGLDHRAQGDPRPQFGGHEIHAADLAVQK